MNRAFRVKLVVALIVICSTSATAKEVRPGLQLEGLQYPKARKIIISYGWTPFNGGCLENEGPTVCSQFPETINCTQGQPEFCILRFAKTGRCLEIITRGGYLEDDGGTLVDRVSFTKERCKKSF